ncbi:hypothetical protein OsJ_02471 [Oryza sativa Japonica Group]|uniref:Uncharacterized protein n=1 Tax=Oryza sativa subsp. japonica TaxID=39947 RepID=B9EXW1_ORYSJ|nr:hypothetical protein OsJ_02471 [Oryza sativa Japonica Group]
MDHRENQAFHGGAHDVHGKGHVIGVDQREQLNLRAADEQPVKVISLSVSLAQDELPQAWQEDGFAGPQGQLLRWLAKERDSVAHHGGAGEDLGREGGGTAHAAEVHDDKILDVVIAFQGTDPIPEAVVAVEAGDGESDGVEGARVGVSGARHRLHHRRVCFWKPLATGPTMGQNRASSRTEGHKSLDPGLGMGQHHWRQAGGTQGREELGWELADAGSIRWGSGVGGGWRQRKPIEDPQSTQLDDFEFWEEINSVECVRSSIKKVVFHGFSWKNSEIAFINSIAEGGLVLGKICIFQSRHGTAPDDDELNAKLSMVASLNIGLGRTEIIFSGEDPTWCSRAAADLSRADPSNAWAPVAATVSRVIENHPGPFQTVTLTSYFPESERDTFAGWIRAVAAKGFRDLTLHNIPLVGPPRGPRRPPPGAAPPWSASASASGGSRPRPASSTPAAGDGDGAEQPSFPRLRELVLNRSAIEEADLENVVACSPALRTLVLAFSRGAPGRVRLASGSLRCVVLCQSLVDELAVVAAPLLERIVLRWCASGTHHGHLMRIRISRASSIKAIGYLKPTCHGLHIDATVIKICGLVYLGAF